MVTGMVVVDKMVISEIQHHEICDLNSIMKKFIFHLRDN